MSCKGPVGPGIGVEERHWGTQHRGGVWALPYTAGSGAEARGGGGREAEKGCDIIHPGENLAREKSRRGKYSKKNCIKKTRKS